MSNLLFFLFYIILIFRNTKQQQILNNYYKLIFGKLGCVTNTLYLLQFFSNTYKSLLFRYLFFIKIILLENFKNYFYLIEISRSYYFYVCFNNCGVFFSFPSNGRLHPITVGIRRILLFFVNLGFLFVIGREVEIKKYNFFLLNISEDHVVHSESDTFYFTSDKLLRTHTSAVQIREMKKRKPPFGLFSIGRVYRRDSDATHTPMFFQTECFVVSKKVTFNDLFSILTRFILFFFNDNIQIRVRPSYFPFTEPSFEVDIKCFYCCGKFLDCLYCNGIGWVEILGAGCVHKKVLKNCDINYDIFSGFAFGLGIDRLVAIYHKILDLRLNFLNNLQYLEQF